MGTSDAIEANRAERAEHTARIEALDAELVQLVKQGFAEKIPATELAAKAGVSRARIYQIRDGRR